MLQIDETYSAWLLLAGRVSIALVYLVSGLHKGLYYQKAVAEFREARIPLIALTLPGTIALHLAASVCIIIGYFTREAALALALFTILATLKVHAYWRLPVDAQLGRSRIAFSNLAVTGGLLLLVAMGPGRMAISI